jgi:hypothetical protein
LDLSINGIHLEPLFGIFKVNEVNESLLGHSVRGMSDFLAHELLGELEIGFALFDIQAFHFLMHGISTSLHMAGYHLSVDIFGKLDNWRAAANNSTLQVKMAVHRTEPVSITA